MVATGQGRQKGRRIAALEHVDGQRGRVQKRHAVRLGIRRPQIGARDDRSAKVFFELELWFGRTARANDRYRPSATRRLKAVIVPVASLVTSGTGCLPGRGSDEEQRKADGPHHEHLTGPGGTDRNEATAAQSVKYT